MLSTLLTEIKWAARMALRVVLTIIFAVILFTAGAVAAYTYVHVNYQAEQMRTWNL